ncbi:ATP-binding protein [Trueperella pyogenes]|uniref:ATP-binding protein n=1 Tax=Trueperella pyogenes TaxID=1661 RepID=UPI00345D22CA
MALRTSLAGRVQNTTLPKTHALLPLLEAVVNGIQAIDARYGDDVERGLVRVRIERAPQEAFDLSPSGPGRVPLKPIVGFSVEDNGVGFTPENMVSFETLDSDFKSGLGCRGVGRLLWLKAFDRVEVRSAYRDDTGSLQGRQFRFSVAREVEQDPAPEDIVDAGTVVRLTGFKKPYQQSAAKTVEAISREVFEHCIWYFLRPGGAPDVIVSDDDGEPISLRELLDDSGYSETTLATLEIKGEKFDLLGLRLKSSARNSSPRLHWCAANRVVKDESIAGKVPGLYGRLKDETSAEFTYVCYLSSTFLDDHVRSDRTDFDLPERVTGDTLIDEPSLDDIKKGVFAEIARSLAEPLASAQQAGLERMQRYVSTKAPKYRPLIKRIESLGIAIDPSIKDQDLEIELHRCSQKIEADVLAEGQAVFTESSGDKPEEYDERLARYLETVKDLNQSDLANYVFRRRTTLDILDKLIQADSDGKYAREESIHNLLFPMRKESTEVGDDASNLWIIDERLVFHDYLASDKAFKSIAIADDDSMKRPDVLATRVIEPDSPVLTAEGKKLPLQSIVIVELKRPMRDDATEGKNPIEQCLDYVARVRAGDAKTATGRLIPSADDPPAFCYIVADLTPTMVSRCKLSGLTMTHDGMGYFGFIEPYKAYVEVMSFDRLVNAATERNRAFFDKLGLPSS